MEVSKIEKTASCIFQLVKGNIPNANNIKLVLESEIGPIKSPVEKLSFLIISRHLTSRKILKELDNSFQIIEMGAGFSPHGLNYNNNFSKYLEIDLPFNSQLKKKVAFKVDRTNSIVFISGSLYEESTWREVSKQLDPYKPIFLFCEGVVSHYASEEQKDNLAKQIYKIFTNSKSRLYLDDTLKNHPELNKHKVIKRGKSEMHKTLAKTSYVKLNERTLDLERNNWKKRGFEFSKEEEYISLEGFEEILSKLKGSFYKKIR